MSTYIKDEYTQALAGILGSEYVLADEPMSAHTSFKVGGPCDYFVSPGETKQVLGVIDFCKKEAIPFYIIGNGSNLLVSDKGFEGVMIHLGSRFAGHTIEETKEGAVVSVKAGTSLGGFVRAVSRLGLGDMSWASGIPGSFGGAVVMNAGAYGGEMKQVLTEVTWLDEEGNVQVTPAGELGMGYRQSIFKHTRRVVLEGKVALKKMSSDEIFARIEELNRQRKEKQPLEYPSAGSTFKRPEGYFAGKLIQDSGLRGYRLGGAQVSEKHCGFVINRDHASAGDIYKLFQYIRKTVSEHFQVEMELEVELIGSFDDQAE